MRRRELGTTDYPILFFMADSADHITGLLGLAPTVLLSKNGAGFNAALGAVAEVGKGWYTLAGNATDRDTLGTLVVHAEAALADSFDMDIAIIASDPPTVAEIRTELDANSTTIKFLVDRFGGNTKLINNQMICYKSDGVTEVCRFNLLDKNGVASMTSVYEKKRV